MRSFRFAARVLTSLAGHFAIHPTGIQAIQNPGGLTIVTDQIYYEAYTGISGYVWGPGDVSSQAHQDMMNAYTDGYTRAPTQAVDTRSVNLGGQTFTAGMWVFPAVAVCSEPR